MKKFFLFLFAIAALSLFFCEDADAQCAMCKAVAETGSKGQDQASFGEQLNIGILFLMAIPYLFILILPLIFFRRQIASFVKEFRGIHKS